MATTQAEAIYAEWLLRYAERQPELAIAMTSADFVMINNTTVPDRAQALAFRAGGGPVHLEPPVHQRPVVAHKELPHKAALLLSRVDCTYQTVVGPLDAHFLETIIVDKRGVIIYDHFSDITSARQRARLFPGEVGQADYSRRQGTSDGPPVSARP